LASMKKGSAPKKSAKKPSTSNLQKLINKKNSKYKGYKGSGVDIKKDAERPAKPIGKRKSKSGNTYYEYRLNRTDIKQPPKRYPKLEDGGMMAKGGFYDKKEEVVFKFKEGEKIKVLQYSGGKLKPTDATIYQHYAAEQPDGTYFPFYWVVGSWKNFDEGKKHPTLYAEDELINRHKNNPKMADGGMMDQGYDDREDERLAMEHGKMSKKYFVGSHKKKEHSRRDDARFEERKYGGMMAKGGAVSHGLKMGDKIVADQFWENSVVVDNPKTGRAVVYLETGKRVEGGKMEHGGDLPKVHSKTHRYDK